MSLAPRGRNARRQHAAVLALLLSACSNSETEAAVSPSAEVADAGQAPRGDGSARSDSPAAEGVAPGAACGQIALAADRTVPTVWLLIDGSGSMVTGFDGLVGSSRWQVLREALLAETHGLVARLEGAVAFGMLIYDGGLSPPGIKTDLCPGMVAVPPALNNYGALRAAYPALPLGASTPTHHALQELAKRIATTPPVGDGPTYVVVATDGMPNFCDFHDGLPPTPDTERQAIEAVAALAADGIASFAISMAGGDPFLEAHLDAVARAGGVSQAAFTPSSEDALIEALQSIVGRALPCTVMLEGSVAAGVECAGAVALGGTPLACDGPDGFRVHDDRRTLELLGAACDRLQHDPEARLTATFPCRGAPGVI